MSQDQELLKKYSKELGFSSEFVFTLEQLITSHRYLREENLKRIDERSEEMKKLRERTVKNAREEVLYGEYVSIEKLRTMTINEIHELITRQNS